MYHFDPFTREPVRCTFAHSCCPVAPTQAHYCNISEAVCERQTVISFARQSA